MSTTPSARSLRSQLGLNSLLTVVLGLAVLFGVNYAGYRYYARHDFSKGGYYKLSDKTVQVLKSLPEPVQVTTLMANSPIRSQIEDLLKEYKFKGGDKVKLDLIDAAVDLPKAEDLIKKYSLDPAQENVVVFEYQGKHKVLADTDLADYGAANPFNGQQGEMQSFKGEPQFTAAIQALAEGKTAKVYFLTGQGERDLADITTPGGIGGLKVYIERDNSTTAPLSLAQAGGAVPADADALVIAGPRAAFAPAEVQAISAYLANKGKVLLLQDPRVVSGLEPVLQRYGILLQDDKVIGVAHVGGVGIQLPAIGTEFADHPAVRSLKGLQLKMENARSLALVNDPANPNLSKVVPLVKTPAGFWGETNLDDPKPQFDKATDIAGPLTLAMAYDGGEIPGDGVKLVDTRLVVVGSSSFLTNQLLDGSGLDFFLNALNWELQKDDAIGISPKGAQEFGLNISPLQKSTIFLLALIVAPGAAAVLGVLVWWARRR